jgi:hypothetical protein
VLTRRLHALPMKNGHKWCTSLLDLALKLFPGNILWCFSSNMAIHKDVHDDEVTR